MYNGGYSGAGNCRAGALLDHVLRLNVPEDIRWSALNFFFYVHFDNAEVAIDSVVQYLENYAMRRNIPYNHYYAEDVTEEMQPTSEVLPQTHEAYADDEATAATEESSPDDEADLAAYGPGSVEAGDVEASVPEEDGGTMLEDVEEWSEDEWSEEEL